MPKVNIDRISVSSGVTLNIGEFESIRVDCSLAGEFVPDEEGGINEAVAELEEAVGFQLDRLAYRRLLSHPSNRLEIRAWRDYYAAQVGDEFVPR